MPKLHTNKCILKVKWKCPNPDCVDEPVQIATAFSVKIIRTKQVIDTKCDHCDKVVRLELN